MADLALGSEKSASSPTPASSTPAAAPKLRSCVVCRSRKVRCDKQSPCSNCRRANIACSFPSSNHPPRWAQRLERRSNETAAVAAAAAASNVLVPQDPDPGVGQVMDRLRNLEALVKELSGQLEQAQGASNSAAGSSSGVGSPESSTNDRDAEHQRDTTPATSTSSVQKQFGRLVLQSASRSRYVSSGFWSWVNDELDELKVDTRDLARDESNSSDDEALPGKSSTNQELERTPSERHAFLFRHNMSPSDPDLRKFHPLPSQIPFLIDMFSENVNFFIQIVHVPTVTKMVRDLRGRDMTRLSPSNEALMFSIYYAAITSMEEDDIMTNFGSSKSELSLKYRLGLEHALAKADFLNVPDIILVQAFALFLCVVRRHDSPRFVWMMTGLVIRMAQYLGLQRDGVHFERLSPFEIEMRRRVWWTVCQLDLRASEDQGTEVTIMNGSFDTGFPLNINDADINPDLKEMPTERIGPTDMSFTRVSAEFCVITKKIMARSTGNNAASLEDQSRMLNQMWHKCEQDYLQYRVESEDIAYWVAVTITRLMMAKMTLIIFLPVLFSSPSEQFSDEIRTKLLVAAIEVAEYNHALNTEEACRQWRWVYQSYTHWHAIVFLMIEISRRPWSPIIERAWVALHSSWLIPAQRSMDKRLRIWVPLRKLMAKARRHRDVEVNRLLADSQAAARLEIEDQNIPLPSSSGPFPTGSSVDIFRERWRRLVALPDTHEDGAPTDAISGAGFGNSPIPTTHESQSTARSDSAYASSELRSEMTFQPIHFETNGQQAGRIQHSANLEDPAMAIKTATPGDLARGQNNDYPDNAFHKTTADWPAGHTGDFGRLPWLWTDDDPLIDVDSNMDLDPIDVNMDFGSKMNWYKWVESAKGI